LQLDDLDDLVPGPGEVRINAVAAALNFNDIDMCRGRYPTINPPLPFRLGMEVAGIVDETSPGLEEWLGKRVVAVPTDGHGGYAEQVLAQADMTFDAPPTLNDTEAAGFVIAFQTAHLLLHRRGRIQAGETILIHSGAGGVGSAAIQLAVAAGATVFATAGGPTKLALCRELGAQHVIDYRSENFAQRVLELTSGVGVDLIFDLVGGEVAHRSFECIAREGRYLVAGFSGGITGGEAGLPPRPLCLGNFSVIGGMMAWRSDIDLSVQRAGGRFNPFSRQVGEDIHRDLLELLDHGRVRPVIGQTVEFSAIPAALEDLEARKTVGKTVALIR